jgi:glycosyltransferase involved in cell wall biosynthesis
MSDRPAMLDRLRSHGERVCMHAPSAVGGHPLYVKELLTALTRHPRGGKRFELVAGADLEPQFKTDVYPVHPVLPPLRHRRELPSKLSWACDRLLHYPRRDRFFLNWLKTRPDIAGVHFQEFSLSLPPLIRAIRRTGRRVFYTIHNIRPHAYPPAVPRSVWDAWNRRACLLADRLLVHSERLRDDLAEFLGRGDQPPIAVTPHGVWTPGTSADIPREMAKSQGPRRLLFFGTIRRNKGLDLLFRAAEQLREFEFTIAGEPREAEYFRVEVVPRIEQLRQSGIRIELIDRFIPEQEVPAVFAAHDAIVLPYTEEFTAQSGVVFLAIAHGTPVVASEAGGLRDLFRQFQVGTTFREPTPEALVTAVRTCLDQAACGTFEQPLRAARQHFSWEATAEATIAAYTADFETNREADERISATIPAHQYA